MYINTIYDIYKDSDNNINKTSNYILYILFPDYESTALLSGMEENMDKDIEYEELALSYPVMQKRYEQIR